ncbi:MAG: hypothetical protein Unbinned4118contig1001_26 [Prokaryotic dsDNA virus sp.]|jgi:hypothetical protein|nr:MAG: hypothetical protein Unbinned4118contig1001_26 [Prokaryotic dsDNA virus sp.]|tara:strand:+ start:8679 stop:9215 length:537 start_codon:yes stop_codon:yes gene_type:complete
MGQLLAAIENSAIKEIHIGPMIWRLKKICSADLAEVGHAALAMSQGLEGASGSSDDMTPEQVQKLMSSQSAEKLKTMARLKDAVVAAGLIAVGNPDTNEFENVKVVLDSDKSDAENGVMWVGSIPNNIADELFTECLSLATDGGAAVERLQAFREESRQSLGLASNSKDLQHASSTGS